MSPSGKTDKISRRLTHKTQTIHRRNYLIQETGKHRFYVILKDVNSMKVLYQTGYPFFIKPLSFHLKERGTSYYFNAGEIPLRVKVNLLPEFYDKTRLKIELLDKKSRTIVSAGSFPVP